MEPSDREQFLTLCLSRAIHKLGGSIEVREDDDEEFEGGMLTWRQNKTEDGYIINYFPPNQIGHA